MSSSAIPPGTATLEEQLAFALKREAFEEVLSASRAYLTACFSVFAYDFILTFPQEYRTMWKAERWTPIRVVFFINRYCGLIDLLIFMTFLWIEIDPKVCDKIQFFQPVTTTVLFLACEFLLGARVWAMWDRQRWIIYFFGIFAICGSVVEIIAILPDRRLELPPGLKGCIGTGHHSYLWTYWLPPLLYDTTATIFALIPLIRHWRISPRPRPRLLTIFLRDGMLYFLVASTCNLVNVIYFLMPNVTNKALNAPLTIAFTTMMASRIVLNLRSGSNQPSTREELVSKKIDNLNVSEAAMFNQLVNNFNPATGNQSNREDLERSVQVRYGPYESQSRRETLVQMEDLEDYGEKYRQSLT
ncbi:hypothetical protein BT69DRAFT_764566 [Atractiella rhizophila]|nr:hypothetical protein BT69DRAFT_764566 [Atractiella rhizophila]